MFFLCSQQVCMAWMSDYIFINNAVCTYSYVDEIIWNVKKLKCNYSVSNKDFKLCKKIIRGVALEDQIGAIQ